MLVARLLLAFIQTAVSLPNGHAGPELLGSQSNERGRPLPQWAVQLDGSFSDAKALARRIGMQLDRKVNDVEIPYKDS